MDYDTVLQLVACHTILPTLTTLERTSHCTRRLALEERRVRCIGRCAVASNAVWMLLTRVVRAWKAYKETPRKHANSWSRARRSDERLLLWIPAR